VRVNAAILIAASVLLSGLLVAATLYLSRFEAFDSASCGVVRVDRYSGEVVQCTSHIGGGGRPINAKPSLTGRAIRITA
jgi:hypothetical protein